MLTPAKQEKGQRGVSHRFPSPVARCVFTVDVVVRLVVAVSRLRVRGSLGIFHGQGMVQAVFQSLVLGVVGRRRLRLLAVTRHETRSNAAQSKQSVSARFSTASDTTSQPVVERSIATAVILLIPRRQPREVHLRVRVHLVILRFRRVFSPASAKQQQQGREQQENCSAHYQRDQSRHRQSTGLCDVRRPNCEGERRN